MQADEAQCQHSPQAWADDRQGPPLPAPRPVLFDHGGSKKREAINQFIGSRQYLCMQKQATIMCRLIVTKL